MGARPVSAGLPEKMDGAKELQVAVSSVEAGGETVVEAVGDRFGDVQGRSEVLQKTGHAPKIREGHRLSVENPLQSRRRGQDLRGGYAHYAQRKRKADPQRDEPLPDLPLASVCAQQLELEANLAPRRKEAQQAREADGQTLGVVSIYREREEARLLAARARRQGVTAAQQGE
jgi:hypothetical protein